MIWLKCDYLIMKEIIWEKRKSKIAKTITATIIDIITNTVSIATVLWEGKLIRRNSLKTPLKYLITG
jgi:hypothetical protein